MLSPQPTNLAYHCDILWHIKVCDDRRSGWLQRPTGDPVCLDPTNWVAGRTLRVDTSDFICMGSLALMGAA